MHTCKKKSYFCHGPCLSFPSTQQPLHLPACWKPKPSPHTAGQALTHHTYSKTERERDKYLYIFYKESLLHRQDLSVIWNEVNPFVVSPDAVQQTAMALQAAFKCFNLQLLDEMRKLLFKRGVCLFPYLSKVRLLVKEWNTTPYLARTPVRTPAFHFPCSELNKATQKTGVLGKHSNFF